MRIIITCLIVTFMIITLSVSSLRKQSILSTSIAAASKRIIRSRFPNTSQSISMSSASIKEVITKSLSENSVMVFSKSYCPYCSKTKSTLESLKIPYGVLELDKIAEGADIQAELLAMTGQRTVPNVFVKGKHIGGNDSTQAAIKDGSFQAALK